MGREGRLAEQFPAGLNSGATGNKNEGDENNTHLRVIDGMKGSPMSAAAVDLLDERSYGKSTRQHVREFGAVMALAATVISCFMIRHPERAGTAIALTAAGFVIYGLSLATPRLIVPVWRAWMGLAHYLGLFVTSVLLTAMWVAVVIPVGIAVKLLRVKVMDLSFRAPVKTYWEDRDPALHDFKLLERQW